MASIDYYLKRRKNKEKHPVYLRIIHRRESNLVPVNIKVEENQWNKREQKVRKSHTKQKQLNEFLKRYKLEIETEIFYWVKKNPQLRSSDLKQRILKYNKTGGSDSIPEIDFFEFSKDIISGFKKAGKYQRKKNYSTVINKMKHFWKRKKLHFYEIDVTFLRRFELFLQEEYDNNPNTIKNNMKKIRKLFNDAIRESITTKDLYPFDRYTMPSKKVYKTKLSEDEIKLFASVDSKIGTRLFDAQQMFLFAYYCWGMRFRDVLQLRWNNIEEGRLSYITSKSTKQFSLKLPTPAKEILDLYRVEDSQPIDFIFPLFDNRYDYSDPTYMEKQVSAKNAIINQRLNDLQALAGIKKHISFHISRHSFAQRARVKGITVDDIKDLLGHSDYKTTMNYIESLGEEHLDSVAAGIFD
ncbi:site-specific integrase [Rhodohalobacter sp. 8-1]|uniref:site-specific integrase n=1 Tax=Rhodohalobacter sp. 8-1 TaxID=3131972 RepID=UPI0030EF6446